MTVEDEVLDATADDWESLDQIFMSIRLEPAEHVDPNQPDVVYWKMRNAAVLMAEIIETIQRLVRIGHLDARRDDGSVATDVEVDDVVRGWFRITRAGRFALVARQE